MTALGNINAGGRILAADVRSVAPLAVIKGADESVTSSTTVQNDDALFLPVVTNASYLMFCYLDYEGGTGGSSDLKLSWASPASSTVRCQKIHVDSSNATQVGVTDYTSLVVTARTAGAGNLQALSMIGTFVTTSTAGNLQLLWAQNTSSGTATIVHVQSYLALWRIS